jgi:hypothetical protein
MALPAPVLKQRFFDSNGDPLVGGKLYSYIAGTATPAATYIDSSGSTPNTNPIISKRKRRVRHFLSARVCVQDRFGRLK